MTMELYDAARTLLLDYLRLAPAARAGWVRALKPTTSDYARVFHDEVAALAEAGYAVLWGNAPVWPVRDGETEVRVAAARTEDLATRLPIERWFPGGYATVAHHLRPGVWWLSWEFLIPGSSAGPQGAPSAGPQGAPSAGPQGAPSAGPQGAPSAGPQGAPSAGPQGAPSAGPQGAPSAGSLFDGLVLVEEGRFAWFPRPWKVLPRGGPGVWTE